jgi:hypothetical protein
MLIFVILQNIEINVAEKDVIYKKNPMTYSIGLKKVSPPSSISLSLSLSLSHTPSFSQ